MSEIKRVALNTLEPPKVNDKVIKKACKTIRISVILPESNEGECPEYNYKDQLAAVKRRVKQSSKETNNGDNGLDPFEEHDDDVKRIALEMEAKYGSGVINPKRKRKGRKDDYADIGMGYDETDSFIDNTDGYDEIIPQNVTTLHGGFYINCGALEFKTDEEASSEISSSSSESDAGEPKPNRKRILDTTEDESGSDTANISNAEKKLKTDTPNNTTMQQAIKKKLFSQNKIQVKKRRLIDPLKKTVKELLREKRVDLNMSIPPELETIEENMEKDSLKENKKPMSITSVNDAIESVLKQVVEEDFDKNQNKQIVDINKTVDLTVHKTVSNAPSSIEGESSQEMNNKSEKQEVVKLPENLPPDILDIVQKLKKAALEYKGEGKKKFFTAEVNLLLLSLERKCKILGKSSRVKVYEHLSPFMKYRKETIIRRAKILVLEDDEKRIKRLTIKLKDTIDYIMPSLLLNFEQESQKILAKKFSKESTENEENKALKMPRRRFHWSDESKKLLKDILSIKKRCLLLEGKTKDNLDEQIFIFLRTVILPLWPEGWMYLNNLKKVYITMADNSKLGDNNKSKNISSSSSSAATPKHSSNVTVSSVLNSTNKTAVTNSITVTKINGNEGTTSNINPPNAHSVNPQCNSYKPTEVEDVEGKNIKDTEKSGEQINKLFTLDSLRTFEQYEMFKSRPDKLSSDSSQPAKPREIINLEKVVSDSSKSAKHNEMFAPHSETVSDYSKHALEKEMFKLHSETLQHEDISMPASQQPDSSKYEKQNQILSTYQEPVSDYTKPAHNETTDSSKYPKQNEVFPPAYTETQNYSKYMKPNEMLKPYTDNLLDSAKLALQNDIFSALQQSQKASDFSKNSKQHSEKLSDSSKHTKQAEIFPSAQPENLSDYSKHAKQRGIKTCPEKSADSSKNVKQNETQSNTRPRSSSDSSTHIKPGEMLKTNSSKQSKQNDIFSSIYPEKVSDFSKQQAMHNEILKAYSEKPSDSVHVTQSEIFSSTYPEKVRDHSKQQTKRNEPLKAYSEKPPDSSIQVKQSDMFSSTFSESGSEYSKRQAKQNEMLNSYSEKPSDSSSKHVKQSEIFSSTYPEKPSDYSKQQTKPNEMLKSYSERPSDSSKHVKQSEIFSSPYPENSSDFSKQQTKENELFSGMYSEKVSNYSNEISKSDSSKHVKQNEMFSGTYPEKLSDYTKQQTKQNEMKVYPQQLSDYSKQQSKQSEMLVMYSEKLPSESKHVKQSEMFSGIYSEKGSDYSKRQSKQNEMFNMYSEKLPSESKHIKQSEMFAGIYSEKVADYSKQQSKPNEMLKAYSDKPSDSSKHIKQSEIFSGAYPEKVSEYSKHAKPSKTHSSHSERSHSSKHRHQLYKTHSEKVSDSSRHAKQKESKVHSEKESSRHGKQNDRFKTHLDKLPSSDTSKHVRQSEILRVPTDMSKQVKKDEMFKPYSDRPVISESSKHKHNELFKPYSEMPQDYSKFLSDSSKYNKDSAHASSDNSVIVVNTSKNKEESKKAAIEEKNDPSAVIPKTTHCQVVDFTDSSKKSRAKTDENRPFRFAKDVPRADFLTSELYLDTSTNSHHGFHQESKKLSDKPLEKMFASTLSSSTPKINKSEGDDIQMVMENLKALQKLSCSPIKNESSAGSPVSVIAYNKNFSSKSNSNQSGTGPRADSTAKSECSGGFQDEFQKQFINSLQQMAASSSNSKPSYNRCS